MQPFKNIHIACGETKVRMMPDLSETMQAKTMQAKCKPKDSDRNNASQKTVKRKKI